MKPENVIDAVPDSFWKTIDDAGQDPGRFRSQIQSMNRSQIIHFYWTYEKLANALRTERYIPHVHPDISEDGLAELANWVVAQGKVYYQQILDRPDQIPPKKDDAGLLSEAVEEYEDRYSDDIPLNTHEWDNEWRDHGKSGPWA